MKKNKVLGDQNFINGFKIIGINPTENQREVKKYITNNKSNKDSIHWFLSQWWTPYDLGLSNFKKIEGLQTINTESRKLTINNNNELTIYLNGKKEYLNNNRNEDQSWCHFLIEQDFTNKINVLEANNFNLELDFTLDFVNDFKEFNYDSTLHAAQFLLYFVIFARQDEDKYQYEGFNQEFMWFGVPIYDNRLDKFEQVSHVDSGSEGTTNRLIYLMDSDNYLEEKLKMGKKYSIKIDLLPHIKKALDFAIENGYLPKKALKYEIGYLNLGWELPGAYEVQSTIHKINIESEKGRK